MASSEARVTLSRLAHWEARLVGEVGALQVQECEFESAHPTPLQQQQPGVAARLAAIRSTLGERTAKLHDVRAAMRDIQHEMATASVLLTAQGPPPGRALSKAPPGFRDPPPPRGKDARYLVYPSTKVPSARTIAAAPSARVSNPYVMAPTLDATTAAKRDDAIAASPILRFSATPGHGVTPQRLQF